MAYAAAIKAKIDRENRKRGYEVQIEELYPVEKLQNTGKTFKSMTKFIVRWDWHNNPRKRRKITTTTLFTIYAE